jgi:hypothetical protein
MQLKINPWILVSAAAVFLALFLWQACKKASPCQENSTTTVRVDTLTWIVHDTIPSKPQLVKSEPITDTLFRDSILLVHAPVKGYDSLLQQYNELLALYTTQNEYYDGFVVADTFGGKVDTLAFVSRIDTVAANQIIASRWTSAIYGRNINTTVTNTLVTKPTAKVLVGVSVLGMKEDPIYGVGGMAGLQTRKNKIYLASIKRIEGLKQPVFEATYLIPITFRKKE